MDTKMRNILLNSSKEDLIRIIEILISYTIVQNKRLNYSILLGDTYHKYISKYTDQVIEKDLELEIDKDESKYVVYPETDCLLDSYEAPTPQDLVCVETIKELIENRCEFDIEDIRK